MKVRSIIGSTAVALFTVGATVVGATVVGATAASAATPGLVSSSDTCVTYAKEVHTLDDWACVSGVLYARPRGSNESATEVRTFQQSTPSKDQSQNSVRPLAIVNESLSNTTEPVVASVGGIGYNVPVNLKVSLYNHSPKVDSYYTSGKAVSLTWNMRIRQDIAFAPDRTAFTYSRVYGSSFYTTYAGVYSESQYGEAYNVLPYDGNKYFVDLYNVSLKTPSGNLSILGSIQSDRMTCYKTVPCKFK